MKILVTGATGFIGSSLINELIQSNKFEIIATSRDQQKAKQSVWFEKVKYLPYDLEKLTYDNLYKYFDKPDLLIHLAWDNLCDYSDLAHIEKNFFYHYRFLKNMLENGLKDLTVTGTCLEYGMQNGCLSEEQSANPSTPYAIAKDTLRKYLKELQKTLPFDYRWIRLFYMYGEGQAKRSLISLLDKAIQNNDERFNMSGGEQLRDYLHISEVVKNIIQISNQKIYINEVINCCKGEPVSIRSFVEEYLKKHNSALELNLGYYPYPNYEPMAFWGDNTKLKKIKGNDD